MFSPDFVQQRYIVTLFGFFLTIITSISKYSISITITEMVKSDYVYNVTSTESSDVCPITSEEEIISLANESGEFDWSSESQGLIISAVFWLYAFLQTPCGILVERCGAKSVLVSGQLLSGICMIILPSVARYTGVVGVIIDRVLIGVGQTAVYPCLSVLLANWVPPQEKSSLGAMILIGENVGVIVAMAVSGLILGNIENSWALTFYLYGIITITWAILWIIFGYNDPDSNPYISDKEKEYLRLNISKGIVKKKLPPLPVKSMFTSAPLWACLLAHFGHDWGIISITSDLPKYMKYVLHYDIEANGLLSALPYIIVTTTGVIGGWLSDFLNRRQLTTTTTSRKLLTTISSFGPALGLVGVIYAGCDKEISVIMFTIGMGLMGFFYSSLAVNAIDLSPNYAGTVMGIAGIGTTSGIISPYLTGVITTHHSLQEWHIVFGLSIGMLSVTNLIFVLFGSGDVQPWDEPLQKHEINT